MFFLARDEERKLRSEAMQPRKIDVTPVHKAVLGAQRAGTANEHLGEVGVDSPVATFVGIAERALGNSAAKSGMAQLRRHGVQASLDVAQTLAVGQLSESHRKELVATREIANAVVAAIAPRTLVGVALGNEIHELSEYQPALAHRDLLST